VIDTIKKLRDMLLGVLQRAKNAIDLILEDPIRFLGNLAEGVKRGLFRFIDNIAKHLQAGLLGWLFGALAEAGIDLPQTFDLRGILSLILQVLGLTYRNIRARAVKILGEKIVSALESTAEVFLILINEGPAGLIRFLKEKVEALKETMMEQIRTFVTEKIIVAGIKWIIGWIIGLLNPAGAFIKACMAIYDIVMFFVNSGQRIMALVNAVIDSVTNIAQGNLEGAASWIENALAKGVPIAISFLASLLGLDGIGKKIQQIIEKIQAPINLAIDWLIMQAVKLVQAAGKLFGQGKKKPESKTLEDKTGVLSIVEARIAEESPQWQSVNEWDKGLGKIHTELKEQGLKSLEIEDSEEGLAWVASVNPKGKGNLNFEYWLGLTAERQRVKYKSIKEADRHKASEVIGEYQMTSWLGRNPNYKSVMKTSEGVRKQGFDAIYMYKGNYCVCEAKARSWPGSYKKMPNPVEVTENKGEWPQGILGELTAKIKGKKVIQSSLDWIKVSGGNTVRSKSQRPGFQNEKDRTQEVLDAVNKNQTVYSLVFVTWHRAGTPLENEWKLEAVQ
jgi:hypothetical protein